MEVGAQIKKYRSNMGISQEELAEKVYVSRQTVSNWETGKNYPDIHSVLLLSSVFNVSLDQLIKGDVEIMKNEIKETEIKKFNGVSQYLCWYCIITSPVGSCAHPLHCANSKFAQWNSRLQTVCPSCRLRNERRWKIMHYSD